MIAHADKLNSPCKAKCLGGCLKPVSPPSRLFTRSLLCLSAILLLCEPCLDAQSACGNAAITLTPDYQFAIGTSGAAGAYTWALNGQTVAQGANPQLLLFHYDGGLASTSGVTPAQSSGASFVPGKFGSALAVPNGGLVSYPGSGNISLADGTIELW